MSIAASSQRQMTIVQRDLATILASWTCVWLEIVDNLSAFRVTWLKPIKGCWKKSSYLLIFRKSRQTDNPIAIAGDWHIKLAYKPLAFSSIRRIIFSWYASIFCWIQNAYFNFPSDWTSAFSYHNLDHNSISVGWSTHKSHMLQHGLQRNTLSNCEYTANRYEYETFQLNIWQLVVGCLAEINMTQSCNFIWKEYRLSEKKGGRKEQRMK